MNIEEMIAELNKWQPDQLAKFLAINAEQQYKMRQTEYDLQVEQQRKLSRKPSNECDDYGMPDYTP